MKSSNTFRDVGAGLNLLFRWVLAGVAVVCLTGSAQGMDPNKAMSQYIHDHWGTENGFPGGRVYAIAQTPDGYLWIGTEKGLVRFDGFNFRLIQLTGQAPASPTDVLGLATDAEGSLWVRLPGTDVLRYRDGKFERILSESEPLESAITAMHVGRKSGMLFWGLRRGVWKYDKGKIERRTPSLAGHAPIVISMVEAPGGTIWLGTRDSGLFYLDHGQMVAVTKGLPDTKVNAIFPINEKDVWIGTDSGVVRWNGGELIRDPLTSSLDHVQTLAMTGDRDGNVWIGTANGLVRLNSKGVSALKENDPRLQRAVTALFEDREGNLWAGSAGGMERIRDSLFTTYGDSEGLPSESNGPVYVDSQDRTWVAPLDGGLYWIRGEHVGRVTEAGLDKDVVYSISGGKSDLWIGRQRGGLTHLREKDGSFTAETYTQREGLAQDSVYTVHQSRDGTVWAGTLSGGVSMLREGKFTTYSMENSLPSNTVSSIVEGADGTMWFGTPNGLSALQDGKWRTYRMRDGLPSENVISLLEDSKGVLWVGTTAGLASFRSGKGMIPRGSPDSLLEPIFGLAEDQNGSLWITTANHVVRVNRDKLLSGSLGNGDVKEYGLADGLHSLEGVRRDRSVVVDRSGRAWLSMNRGLSVVDPRRAAESSAPAIAHIEAVTADGSLIDLHGGAHVPAARQRIVFSYAGLSLAIPERVRFRYKLDHFDRGWSEPVSAREAIYTNLGPGSYRFHVMASNSYGLWNGPETTLGVTIAPAFWQTLWFRLLCMLACGIVILGLYRLRMHQLTRQMNLRFEERLAERMHIAQELHDTLLQGFLSASMQLDIASDQVPEDSPVKPRLERVLQLMREVIEEGRNALRGLRSAERDPYDLEHAFAQMSEELAVPGQVGYRVIVNGTPRTLNPVIRDEVYRIGREALVNAFRHSKANSIEVEVEYTASHLQVVVRDDGCGIDPHVLRMGRDGHWGLPGMRQRAEGISARLKVWSRPAGGTEVELYVPSAVAFESAGSGRTVKWLARFYPANLPAERLRDKRRVNR